MASENTTQIPADEFASWQFDPKWRHAAFVREFDAYFFRAMLCR